MRSQEGGVSDSRGVQPEHGATVVTIDEKRLGIVKAHNTGYFHVRVRWGRDYWLSCDLIRKHEPGRIVLNISRSVLGGYKQKRPSQVSELLSGPVATRPPATTTEGRAPTYPDTPLINAPGGTALAHNISHVSEKE